MKTRLLHARVAVMFAALFALAPIAQATPADVSAKTAHYGHPEQLVGPLPFLGVHGLAVTSDGKLLAGSVVGQTLSQVDPQTGAVHVLIGPPKGMADDIAIGPDGMLAWTSFLEGKLRVRGKNGRIRTVAKGLPGINSLAFSEGGRLFASQVFLGDALYEIDPTGAKPPRKIRTNLGGLNGFEVGSDDWIYGPLWFKGKIVRIDPDSGDMKTVADGFTTPAAANFDSEGRLDIVDSATGQLTRVDPDTGDKTEVAQLKPSLDNLAIAKDGTIYVSNMADDSIQAVDPATGHARTVTQSKLAAPSGVAAVGDTLYIGDTFAYRTMNTTTGSVSTVKRMWASDLGYPGAVSADNDSVVLSSASTNTVQVLDRQSGKTRVILKDFKAPLDAVPLADGSLLVSELGSGSLLKVDPAHPEQRRTVLDHLQGAAGLALAADGKTAYLNTLGGHVWAIDTQNWTKTSIAAGLKQPEGIAVTPAGELVVMETGAQRIVRIDPKSGSQSVIAADIKMDLPGLASNPVGLFNDITVDDHGDLYFTTSAHANAGLHRIRKD